MSDGNASEHRLREILAELADTRADSEEGDRQNQALIAAAEACLSEIEASPGGATQAVQLAAARDQLLRAEQRFAQLRNRRSVRATLMIVDRLSFVYRLVGRARRWIDRVERSGRGTRQRREIARSRSNSRITGPLVSIVVPSHNGASFLTTLFDALEATRYTSIEVIVVDNASTDGTGAVVSRSRAFPVRSILNEQNESFSTACNQGIAAAQGVHVLLLNNDVRPLHPSWLGAMVDRIEDEGIVAVGALLVYPEIAPGASALAVQHAGVRFSWHNGGPRPVNIQTDDATAADLRSDVAVPAATAAALLVSRVDLDAVDGLTDGFVYGWEDVDLCLKLRRRGGRIVICGDAALEHVEFGTQHALPPTQRAKNFRTNSRLFWDRWLPDLTYTLRKELFSDTQFAVLNGHRSTVVIVPAAAADDSVDADDSDAGANLSHEFRNLGWASERVGGDDPASPGERPAALAISLSATYDIRESPEGAIRIAWIRNQLSAWLAAEWLEDFDLIFTPVAHMKTALSRRCGVPVHCLPSATAAQTSNHEASTRTDPIGYIGSPWGTGRAVLDMFDAGSEVGLSLWGKDWSGFPAAERWWRGPIPESGPGDVYRSTKIILEASRAKEDAGYSSRVLDALMNGALVLTDDADLSTEWFDGQLPVYTSRTDLDADPGGWLTVCLGCEAWDDGRSDPRRRGYEREEAAAFVDAG